MAIMDLLRKLGIVRYGSTKKTYRNAREKPLELMQDDVFDEDKDVTIKKDISKK